MIHAQIPSDARRDALQIWLTRELKGPTGIAFSPDEKYLYVGNWDPAAKVVLRFPVKRDGTLGASSVFADLTKEVPGEEALDGIKVDKLGKGIILMHDFQKLTGEALPSLLQKLKAGGYKVVHMKAKTQFDTLPEYDAMMVNEPGRSRWISACQFCTSPIRREGSTANVFGSAAGGATKPFAIVIGAAALRRSTADPIAIDGTPACDVSTKSRRWHSSKTLTFCPRSRTAKRSVRRS